MTGVSAAHPGGAPPLSNTLTSMPGTALDLSGCDKLRASDPSETFDVSIVLKRPKDLECPCGPGHAMPRNQFAAEYGATPAQMDTVRRYAEKNGLDVATADADTRTVKLRGTAQDFQRAFGVRLGQYRTADGQDFRGYDGSIRMPAGVASVVDGVLGLCDRPAARPASRPAPRTGPGFTGLQTAQMYNFPAGTDGRGQTIGIIELGGGYNPDEMQQYFRQHGLPVPSLTWVGVDGHKNAPDGNASGADGEVALDIQVAGAAAPGAKMVVYFAPNSFQGFIDAVNQAAHDQQNKPDVLSVSWGAGEVHWPQQTAQTFNNVLHDAAAMGVNVFVSTGDHGGADGASDGTNNVEVPSSSPWAVACGGTHLDTDGNGHRTGESAWDDGDSGAAGGGSSVDFPVPDYQSGIHPPGKGRGTPDVSGDAAPSTGYDVLVDGKDMRYGGTSAVAPLWAALTSRLNQGLGRPVGFLNPFLYQHPETLNDVTQGGGQSAWSAGPGWDPVTGLGSPDGAKLLSALRP